MSWTLIQNKGTELTGDVAYTTVTPTSNITVGNLLVVGVNAFGNLGLTSFTITDSLSNTWTKDVSSTIGTGANNVALFHAIVTTGGSCTVTITANGATAYLTASVSEYHFTGGSFSVGPTGSNTGTSGTPTGTSLTVTSNALVVAHLDNEHATTITAGSGFTLEYNATNGSGEAGAYEDQLNVGASTLTPTFTGTLTQWAVANVAYYEGGASASFTATPSTIPANHGGSITLTLTGTSTTWSSGSTVTVQNSVTGTTTVTKGTWTRTSNTAATLTVTTGAGTGTYTITIDSVVSPSLTVATASFAISPISGASSTTPTITATGTNTVWTQETASTLFTLSGGTGASISSISVTTDTAATFTLTTGSTSGTLTITDAPTADTATFFVLIATDITNSSIYGHYVQVEGAATLGTNFSTTSWGVVFPYSGGGRPEGAVHFKATISALSVYCYLNGSAVRLVIDGSDEGVVTLANTSAYGWAAISTTLDSTAQHDYVLSWGGTGNSGMFAAKLGTGGGTGISTSTLAARPLIAMYGDSQVLGQASGSGDSTINFTHHIGRLTNYAIANLGIGSTTVYGTGNSGEARTADVTSLDVTPAVVWVLYGTNDVGVTSTGNFQTAYASMLTSIRAGLANAWIICEATYNSGTDSQRPAYNALIAAAVAGLADAKIIFRQSVYLNYDEAAGGGVHPTDVGCCQVAAQAATDIIGIAGYGGSTGGGGGGGRIFTGM